jgi:hypothetical protein
MCGMVFRMLIGVSDDDSQGSSGVVSRRLLKQKTSPFDYDIDLSTRLLSEILRQVYSSGKLE